MQKGFSDTFNTIIKDGKVSKESLDKIFTEIAQSFISMLTKMWGEYLAKQAMIMLFGLPTAGAGAVGGGILGRLFKAIVPTFQQGGEVKQTGLAMVHKGETVLPRGKTGAVSINVNALDLRTIDMIQLETFAEQIAPIVLEKLERR
jgi:hypothetical protein